MVSLSRSLCDSTTQRGQGPRGRGRPAQAAVARLRLANTAWYNSREEEREIIVRGTQETGLDKAQKQAVIAEYRTHDEDTGSTETQVAVLTARIIELTQHLRENKHDESTRRGLLMMVGRRRRLLRYLNVQDVARYRTLISRLGLRR